MKNVRLISNPIVEENITKMRDINTGFEMFRICSKKVTTFLLYEALADAKLKSRSVKTQTGATFKGTELKEKIACISILRASLGTLSAAMEILPEAEFHVVGTKRSEDDPFNKEPNFYLDRLNEMSRSIERVIVLDPMIATGSSIITVLSALREKHKYTGSIQVVCYICAKQGAQAIEKNFPDVKIFCAGFDDKLNSKAFIVPGLGDAGDRFFGIPTNLNTVR